MQYFPQLFISLINEVFEQKKVITGNNMPYADRKYRDD